MIIITRYDPIPEKEEGKNKEVGDRVYLYQPVS